MAEPIQMWTKGKQIIERGIRETRTYFVLKGEVMVRFYHDRGTFEYKIKQGGVINAMESIGGTVYRCDAYALSPAATLVLPFGDLWVRLIDFKQNAAASYRGLKAFMDMRQHTYLGADLRKMSARSLAKRHADAFLFYAKKKEWESVASCYAHSLILSKGHKGMLNEIKEDVLTTVLEQMDKNQVDYKTLLTPWKETKTIEYRMGSVIFLSNNLTGLTIVNKGFVGFFEFDEGELRLKFLSGEKTLIGEKAFFENSTSQLFCMALTPVEIVYLPNDSKVVQRYIEEDPARDTLFYDAVRNLGAYGSFDPFLAQLIESAPMQTRFYLLLRALLGKMKGLVVQALDGGEKKVYVLNFSEYLLEGVLRMRGEELEEFFREIEKEGIILVQKNEVTVLSFEGLLEVTNEAWIALERLCDD